MGSTAKETVSSIDFLSELAIRILRVSELVREQRGKPDGDYGELVEDAARTMALMHLAEDVDGVSFRAGILLNLPRLSFEVMVNGVSETRRETGRVKVLSVSGLIKDIVRGDASVGRDPKDFYLQLTTRQGSDYYPLSDLKKISIQRRDLPHGRS